MVDDDKSSKTTAPHRSLAYVPLNRSIVIIRTKNVLPAVHVRLARIVRDNYVLRLFDCFTLTDNNSKSSPNRVNSEEIRNGNRFFFFNKNILDQ